MKRLFRLLLILGLAAGTWSCADDGTPSVSINGGTDFLSLDHLARSGKITVNAPAPWSVTLAPENYGQDQKPDWLTLSAEEGPAGYSEIDVTFAENPGPARSASLLFSCDGKTLAFTVSQSAGGTGFDAPDYYFYISVGTMPTLYSGLHLLSHDKPSYVSYERASTFDAAEFPDRAFVYPVADPTGHATNEELRAMSEAMKRRILEINAEDPTAVFGLWVDDLRCRLGYDWFVAQGIDSARVKVTMLSDGTATYNNFHNYFGDAATAEQNWNDYAAEVEALDWNHGGRYPETRAPEEFASYTWPYYLSTRPDYRLMLQNSSLMESSCPFIADRLAAMKMESVQPYELLTALPEASKQQFYRMAKFDYARFAGLFDLSPKKNLIIIGTSHSSAASEQQQAAYVERIIQQYGSDYDIFFKPHPADSSSAGYPDRFEGLTLLPGQMPFEIFVWALLDKIDMIGGYPSTTFISVPLDKVGFLFAADADGLVRPLNILFRDAANVEWIQ